MASTILNEQFYDKLCLCKVSSEKKWKCMNCKVLLCDLCKELHYAKDHEIVDVPVKEIIQDETNSFDIVLNQVVLCEQHNRSYWQYCQSCDVLVCLTCISNCHNNHKLKEVSDSYKIKMEKLKEQQTAISKSTAELDKNSVEISKWHKKAELKYQNAKDDIIIKEKVLIDAVHEYTRKLQSDLENKWNAMHETYTANQKHVQSTRAKFNNECTKLQDIIESKDLARVFGTSKSDEFADTSQELNMNTRPMQVFIPGKTPEINQFNFGELRTDIEVKVMNQLATEITDVNYLLCSRDGTVWIYDENETLLYHATPEGNNLTIMSRFQIFFLSMDSLPKSDDLLLCSGEPTLQQLDRIHGKLTDSKYRTDSYVYTTAIHITHDKRVIVGAKKGKQDTFYEHGRNSEILFKRSPCHITTSAEGNICVVDRERLTVLDGNGEVLNIYAGNDRINTSDNEFNPTDMVITPPNNLIVADSKNHYLHVLDSSGKLLTYFNTKDIGILLPRSMSFSKNEHLLISGSNEEGNSKKTILFEVKIIGY
ncbi:unnamed protein product [Mytilus coruscus]|uniref:B box-type domain-containing protein n=1 Tax=Mytilus coruscus TaxID=42192 RepID=A0A6J8DG16_MYTCO|nr:unnamed protein product [Mytilus coruscus]